MKVIYLAGTGDDMVEHTVSQDCVRVEAVEILSTGERHVAMAWEETQPGAPWTVVEKGYET